MSSEERAVRVFVSSTFRDMFLDREVLVKQVFPEISTFCHERGIEFTGIDLRTGVTAEQSESGMTLNLCLREVERCRPYFLCMLGERYGWCQRQKSDDEGISVDVLLKKTFDNTIAQYPEFQWISNYSTSSVTELEIRQGVLNNPAECKHPLFLFRNPEYVNELLYEGAITGAEMSSFMSENTHSEQRLKNLKREIEASGLPVVEYNHHTDIRHVVTQYLKQAIEEDFPSQQAGEETSALHEAREHKAFAESRCRVYVGKQEYYDRLNRYIHLLPDPKSESDLESESESAVHKSSSTGSLSTAGEALCEEDRPHAVFFVHGASGSGKSSLVANWSQRLKADARVAASICYTHLHFVGSSSGSSDPTQMLHRLLTELRHRFLRAEPLCCGLDSSSGEEALPFDWEHLLLLLPEVLQEVSVKLQCMNATRPEGSLPHVLVIVLDALNQLSDPSDDDATPDHSSVSTTPTCITPSADVDAYNKGKGKSKGKSKQAAMSWLPRSLPLYIRMVVSTIDLPDTAEIDIHLHSEGANTNHCQSPPLLQQQLTRPLSQKLLLPLIHDQHTLEVVPLDDEGVKGIAVSYMSGYGKTLAEDQLKMLMACEQTKNPLFLRSVLEEVRVWGRFELLTDQMALYLQKQTLGELFDAILTRLEADFNTAQYPSLVQDSMRALWGSHAGLSEGELQALLGSPRCVFSGLFLSIRQNLTNRNGLLYFFHDYLKQTVEIKYLRSHEDKLATHLMIARTFASQAVIDVTEDSTNVSAAYLVNRKRCLIEVIWQLSCCGETTALILLLILPSVTQLLYESCKINLFKMARTKSRGGQKWSGGGSSGGYKLAAERYLRECSQLLFQDSSCYLDDDFVIVNAVDEPGAEEKGSEDHVPADLKSLLDRIQVEERKLMSEMSMPARVALVRLVADILIQTAEYAAGSQLLSMALQCCNSDDERVGIVAEQAKVCLALSRFEEGITLCEPLVQDLRDCQKRSASVDESTPAKRLKLSGSYYDVMYALAKLYSANGQFSAADPLFAVVLDHRISVFGENRAQTADIMSDIARHNFSQRRYAEALDLSQRVLAIRRVTAGEKTPSFMSAIRDIGLLFHDLAEYEKAERYLLHALEVSENVFGKHHPSVADVLSDLAFASYMKNRRCSDKFNEIILAYERALAIRIACYGDMHKDVANTLNHMANVYRAKAELGDPAAISQAIELYSRAKDIKETNLHSKHPEVLLSRSNIANILLMTERYEEAAVEHEAILLLRQEIYGMDNIQNATSLKNCGLAYMGLGNFEKSLRYHLEALRIRLEGFGPQHPKAAESHACVGDVCAAMRRPEDAVRHYEAAVQAWNSLMGVGNRDSVKAAGLIEKLQKGEVVTEKLYYFM